jgi:hypothetical protein
MMKKQNEDAYNRSVDEAYKKHLDDYMIDGSPAGFQYVPLRKEGIRFACPPSVGDENW